MFLDKVSIFYNSLYYRRTLTNINTRERYLTCNGTRHSAALAYSFSYASTKSIKGLLSLKKEEAKIGAFGAVASRIDEVWHGASCIR